MRIVEIPGGQATLRDPAELKVRQRRTLQAAQMAFFARMLDLDGLQGRDEGQVREALAERMRSMSYEDSLAMLALQDAAIVAHLDSWTLDVPLPTMATVQDLDEDVYAALAEATKGDAAEVDFSPGPGSLDGQGNPTGPSEPSEPN